MDRLDELSSSRPSLRPAVWRARAQAASLAARGDADAGRFGGERVGARLVQRTTRQLVPTASGRRLAARARQLLGDYEQALSRAKENRNAPLQGLLRAKAPSLFGRWHVVPLVSSFLDAHPRLRVELVLSNRSLDLVAEGLDVAVRIGSSTGIDRAPGGSRPSCDVCEPLLHCAARAASHAERFGQT
jgi:DNA-binding transcriptional LysR family regulator